MNKDFYTPENIEAFLENRLSPNEKAFFESEIAKDPLLQNEVNLQKDIIDSLKNYRKAELKSRLNNIEVNTTSYLGVKIAASIVLAGLLGLGIYSYITPEETLSNKNQTETPTTGNSIEAPSESVVKENPTTEKEAITAVEETGAVDQGKNKKHNPSKENAVDETAKVTSPQIMDGFENETFKNEESVTLPHGQISKNAETKLGFDTKIDNTTDKKYHYKFYNNKLFLFGNFDSTKTYFHELNTNTGKQVFLYYEKNSYLLNSNQLEIAPLTKITDKKLIEELNQRQKTLMKNSK